MDLADVVERGQPGRELQQRGAQPGQVAAARGRPAHVGEEIDAVDQLHREERLGRAVEELAERHQVAVGDVVERAELVLEARQPDAVGVAQHLERDRLLQLVIVGLVDHAHPAGAELASDLEARTSVEQGLGAHGDATIGRRRRGVQLRR